MEEKSCVDCQALWPTMFVLKNEVWNEIKGGHPEHVICFRCAEKRLGRMLTYSDFRECPLTDEMVLGVFVYRQSNGADARSMVTRGEQMFQKLPEPPTIGRSARLGVRSG